MSGITDLLLSQISGDRIGQMAQSLGAPPAATERAVEAAIPALIGGLARNATASPQGASSLAAALDRDHDGSLLDNVGPLIGMLSGGEAGGGLGSLLGGSSKGGGGLTGLLGGGSSRRSGGGLGGLLGAAGSLLGGASDSRTTNGAGILKHVFGAKQSGVENAVSKASGLDLAQVGKLLMMLAPMVMGALGRLKSQRGLDASGLAGMLDTERNELTRDTPALGGLMGMLDADGDGEIGDNLADLGAGLLKGYLSRR